MLNEKEKVNAKEKEQIEQIKQKIEKGIQKDGYFYIRMINGEDIHGTKYDIDFYEGEAYITVRSPDRTTYIIIKAKNILYAI